MPQNVTRLSDPLEVPYAVLEIDKKDYVNTIQKVTIAINVQTDLEGSQIPFVRGDRHESIVDMNRLILYGPSGCGKSRLILELVRKKIDKVRKIVIIKPRAAVGVEWGRKDLVSILNTLGRKDMIIWDNFPDGIAQNDEANLRRALDTISSKGLNCLLVAVNPRYLERLRNISDGIPDLGVHEISYGRNILQMVMNQFCHILPEFKECEGAILKNEALISEILWQKEPLPITVLDYFQELVNKKEQCGDSWNEEDAIQVAKELLPRTDYYDYQFETIYNDKKRSDEAYFLYVLKLCYEVRLPRTKTNVARMQKAIFGSSISEESIKKLAMWIYYSGSNYSLHDIRRNAVVFDDVIKRKLTQYLAENFSNLKINNDESRYLVGEFLGKNAKFLSSEVSSWLLETYGHDMRNDSNFQLGFGHGIGKGFVSLGKQKHDEIFEKGHENLLFMRSLGEELGRNFLNFTSRIRRWILKETRNNPAFSRGLGIGLGNTFVLFPIELQNKIFEYAETDQQLSEGMGIGLGSIFQYLPDDLQTRISGLTENDGDFARGVGQGIGHNLISLSDDLRNKTFGHIENNAEFARGFGMGLGNIIYQFPKDLQKQIFLKSEHNLLMAGGLGVGLGTTIFFMPKDYQKMIFRLAENNDDFSLGVGLGVAHNNNYLLRVQKKILKKLFMMEFFSNGAGRGYGYAWQYLSNNTRNALFREAARNPSLARGLGAAIGHNLPSLLGSLRKHTLTTGMLISGFERGLGFGLSRTSHQTNKTKKGLVAMINKSKLFALGAGEGFGFSFQYLSPTLKEKVFKISETNPYFAKGLGEGLGYTFGYRLEDLRKLILEKVKKDKNFAEGFGIGIGRGFKYLKNAEKDQLMEIMQRTRSIHLPRKG